MAIVTMPNITNLLPISLKPSVNSFTTKSIIINAKPNNMTNIPIVMNALNSGKSFLLEIIPHSLVYISIHSHNYVYLFASFFAKTSVAPFSYCSKTLTR